MRSSYGTTGMAPVLAAAVGIRHGWTWVLRAASFRLEVPDAGRPAIGIAITRETARAAVVDLLGGLALTPWADVPMRAAPPVIARRAKLAAAAVHEPELLLIDGLLDGLGPRDTENVAASLRDLGRDTAIVATGRDPAALAMACGEVLTLADGIIVRNLPAHAAHFGGMRAGPGMLAGLPYAGRGELESADMRGHAPCQLRACRT